MSQTASGRPGPFAEGYQPTVERAPVAQIGAVNTQADTTGTIHTGATAHSASAGTYNFTTSTNRTLSVSYSQDNGGTYKKVTITGIVGATPATTSAAEVVAILNANTTFARFMVASDAAGTLKLAAKMPSSRFKMFFTGTACAVLGTVFTTAIATGSAVGGANTAGVALSFTVTDQQNNPIPRFPVYVTGHVTTAGGAVSATGKFGLNSAGEIVDAVIGGNENVSMVTDDSGVVSFYAADSAAEALVVVVVPGHTTAPLAVLCQGSRKVTYS